MKCYNGLQLSDGAVVPCGQCMNCRINKGRKWTARLLLEWASTPQSGIEPSAWFLTLTYDEEFVPRTPEGHRTLQKGAALAWLSLEQKKHGKLRYYLIGEYGDETFRPHYHLALFGVSHAHAEGVCARWPHGHTTCYPMVENRARYLCGYTAKKLTKADDPRLEPGMEPEFRTSSRIPPIGASALPGLIHPYRSGPGRQLLDERGDVERQVRIGGKVYPLDGYMLGKMRAALGVPLRHTDRLAHPNYLDWHGCQDADYEPEINRRWEIKHATKAQLRKINGQTV